MRLHRGVSMVAAVVTLAGVSTPAAEGFENTASPAAAAGTPIALVQHRSSSSTDWLLIGVGGVGAITLAGAGVAATRSRVTTTRTKRVRQAAGV